MRNQPRGGQPRLIGAAHAELLSGNHGFREGEAFDSADKLRQSRYRHGGSSLFEVIAHRTWWRRSLLRVCGTVACPRPDNSFRPNRQDFWHVR